MGLFTIIFSAANVIVMCVGAFLVFTSTIGYSSPEISNEELNKELDVFVKSIKQNPVLYSLDLLNTNLDGVPRKMIRIGITLEMLDEEGFEEVMGVGAEARDSVMKVINSKAFNDIESVQGKLRLKTEIVAVVNSFLDRGVVKNVYFTELAIQ